MCSCIRRNFSHVTVGCIDHSLHGTLTKCYVACVCVCVHSDMNRPIGCFCTPDLLTNGMLLHPGGIDQSEANAPCTLHPAASLCLCIRRNFSCRAVGCTTVDSGCRYTPYIRKGLSEGAREDGHEHSSKKSASIC